MPPGAKPSVSTGPTRSPGVSEDAASANASFNAGITTRAAHPRGEQLCPGRLHPFGRAYGILQGPRPTSTFQRPLAITSVPCEQEPPTADTPWNHPAQRNPFPSTISPYPPQTGQEPLPGLQLVLLETVRPWSSRLGPMTGRENGPSQGEFSAYWDKLNKQKQLQTV